MININRESLAKFFRTFSPYHQNRHDNKLGKIFIDLIQNNLETSCSKNKLDRDLDQAQLYVSRLSNRWFVSKDVQKTVEKVNNYLIARKISKLQNIPFEKLVENHQFQKIIINNHLHHKITKQHQETGLGIRIENGELMIPVATKVNNAVERVFLTTEEFVEKFDLSDSGKVNNAEYLADGFELHSTKGWDTLRPLYRLTEENGQYVHIDTLTGKKETIGEVGKNFTQLINVYPWGWNPKGGSLFGHTWVRFVINGELYHLGANLQGQLVNPDFMATLNMKGKKHQVTNWHEMDQTEDVYGNNQAKRLIEQMEGLQHYIKTGNKVESSYIDEVIEIFKDIRNRKGGTCTCAATTFYKKLTGIDIEQQARSRFSKIVFNSITNTVLDLFWKCVPNRIKPFTQQPLLAVTRGAKPIYFSKV